MTDPEANAPPARLTVYNSAKSHYRRLAVVGLVAIVLLGMPLTLGEVTPDAYQMLFVLIGVLFVWAAMIWRRAQDKREQVVVDTDGVFVRGWHVGTVPWDNIDFIAHSSSVRRSILSALTRSRRGPYLLFKFVATPKTVSDLPAPWSWFQRLWAETELQEPVIAELGLDHKATEILLVIQEHIAWWQSQQPAEKAPVAAGLPTA